MNVALIANQILWCEKMNVTLMVWLDWEEGKGGEVELTKN